MLILVYITILFYTYSSAYVYVISRLWRVSEWWSDPSCGHPLTPSWRTRITVVVPHPLIPPCLPVDTHECLPEVRTKLPKPVDTRHSDPRQTNVHSSLHFVLDQTLPTGIRTQHTHTLLPSREPDIIVTNDNPYCVSLAILTCYIKSRTIRNILLPYTKINYYYTCVRLREYIIFIEKKTIIFAHVLCDETDRGPCHELY